MSMIKVENLTFTYPGSYHNVFENCTFHIDTSWKLGFVGRNGRGKTTLLKLLMGEYEYSGKIISSVEFDYFPYPVSDKGRATLEILSGICPAAEEWEFLRELSYLDVSPDALYRPFMTLSNGEQSKALLAALFLNEGHFLLIDEPTNHLDADARELVSRYLRKKKSYILVSHDRYFLDGCVDHILSLNRATVDVQNGNFSAWLQNFEQQQSFEKARDEHLRKDVQRLKQASRRTADWSDRIEASKYGNGPVDRGSIGHRAAKMMKRSKTIEARQMKAIKEKSALLKNTETAEKAENTSSGLLQRNACFAFPCGPGVQRLPRLRTGLIRNKAGRTDSTYRKERKRQKQHPETAGRPGYPAYRYRVRRLRACHILCSAGYIFP